MKTVIYLDELLLTNFLAAAMLLLCTGLLCARQCSGLRLLAGSAAAAAFSLGILLPELPGVQSSNLCVYLALSPGRLLLCCGAVSALLRAVLFCFGRAGLRSVAAVLELDRTHLLHQYRKNRASAFQELFHP